MAVESKPLFHPEVIRQQVRSFNLPERVGEWQPKLQHWADLIASGRADEFNETALLPDFLTDIFCGLLGYAGPAGPADTFTFSREQHVEVDAKVADAVVGRFQKDKEQFVAVIEGKGTRDPLDRPFAGRRMSAVDQAYRYAINLPCDWIIITSMREMRLYCSRPFRPFRPFGPLRPVPSTRPMSPCVPRAQLPSSDLHPLITPVPVEPHAHVAGHF